MQASRKSWFPSDELTAKNVVVQPLLSQESQLNASLDSTITSTSTPTTNNNNPDDSIEDGLRSAVQPVNLKLPRYVIIQDQHQSNDTTTTTTTSDPMEQDENQQIHPSSQKIFISPFLEAVDTLLLKHFQRKAFVEFNNGIIGVSQTKCILLKNPETTDQRVAVSLIPSSINVCEHDFIVSAEGEYVLHITWTPDSQRTAPMREIITLYGDHFNHLQIVLVGRMKLIKTPRHKLIYKKTPTRPHIIKTNTQLSTPSLKTDNQQLPPQTPLPPPPPAPVAQSPQSNGSNSLSPLAKEFASLVNIQSLPATPALNPFQTPQPNQNHHHQQQQQQQLQQRTLPNNKFKKKVDPILSATPSTTIGIQRRLNHRRLASAIRTQQDNNNSSTIFKGLSRKSLSQGSLTTSYTHFPSSPFTISVPSRRLFGTVNNTHIDSFATSTTDDVILCQWLNHYLTNEDLTMESTGSNSGTFSSIKSSASTSASSISNITTSTSTFNSSSLTLVHSQLQRVSSISYANWSRLNAQRQRAYELYHNHEITTIISAIHKAVQMGKFQVRSDLIFRADKGAQSSLRQLLLSYNPIWLRLGLEILWEEEISLPYSFDLSPSLNNNEQSKQISKILCDFINERFFYNEQLAQTLSNCVQGNIRHYKSPQYDKALNSFVLIKLFSLVLFLDLAKAQSQFIFDADPRLFRPKASFKKSRDILVYISREFLSRHGDIVRQLNQSCAGYRVAMEQSPVEDYRMNIDNLIDDLKDGIRLSKLIEILLSLPPGSLMKNMLCPAVTRLQKIHNVKEAFQAVEQAASIIKDKSTSKTIALNPRDFVDGHGERMKMFLYRLLFHHIFAEMNSTVLIKEILTSRRAYREKILHENNILSSASSSATTTIQRSPLPHLPDLLTHADWSHCWHSFADLLGESVVVVDASITRHRSWLLWLLWEWVRVVVAFYGITVDDYSSFTDGRIFCLLLHHYLPDLQITFDDISFETTLSSIVCFDYILEAERNEHIKNKWHNFRLLNEKLNCLGDVPLLVDADHAKPVFIIALLFYLSKRILPLSTMNIAAVRIQTKWRKYKQTDKLPSIIAKQSAAALIIQKCFRGVRTRRQFKQYLASIVRCQAFIRGWLVRRRHQRQQLRQLDILLL